MNFAVCLVSMVCLVVAACTPRPAASTPEPVAPTVHGEWVLSNLNGNRVIASRPPFIVIDQSGRLTGWTGVNRITSQLDEPSLSHAEFKPAPIISTRMAGTPEAMKLESDVMVALQNARTFALMGDVLQLRDGSGVTLATFSRKVAGSSSPVRAIHGDWLLKTLNGREVTASPPPRIRIEADGAVSGWGGVNKFSSTLDPDLLAKGEFILSTLISTEMAGSPQARALEQEVFAALQSEAKFTAKPDRLDLVDAAGKPLMSFTRKTAP